MKQHFSSSVDYTPRLQLTQTVPWNLGVEGGEKRGETEEMELRVGDESGESGRRERGEGRGKDEGGKREGTGGGWRESGGVEERERRCCIESREFSSTQRGNLFRWPPHGTRFPESRENIYNGDLAGYLQSFPSVYIPGF